MQRGWQSTRVSIPAQPNKSAGWHVLINADGGPHSLFAQQAVFCNPYVPFSQLYTLILSSSAVVTIRSPLGENAIALMRFLHVVGALCGSGSERERVGGKREERKGIEKV